MTWKVDKPFGVEVVGRGPATPALIGLGRICAQEALHDIQLMGGKGIKKRRKALDANNWVEAIVIQNGPIPYIKVKVFSQGGAEEKKLIIAIPFEVYVPGTASQFGTTDVRGTTHVYVAEFTKNGAFVRLVDLGELSGVLPPYVDKYNVCGPYYVVGSDPKNPMTAGTFSLGGYASARVYGSNNRYAAVLGDALYLNGAVVEQLPFTIAGAAQTSSGLVLIGEFNYNNFAYYKKIEGAWVPTTVVVAIPNLHETAAWSQAVQFSVKEDGTIIGAGLVGVGYPSTRVYAQINLEIDRNGIVSVTGVVPAGLSYEEVWVNREDTVTETADGHRTLTGTITPASSMWRTWAGYDWNEDGEGFIGHTETPATVSYTQQELDGVLYFTPGDMAFGPVSMWYGWSGMTYVNGVLVPADCGATANLDVNIVFDRDAVVATNNLGSFSYASALMGYSITSGSIPAVSGSTCDSWDQVKAKELAVTDLAGGHSFDWHRAELFPAPVPTVLGYINGNTTNAGFAASNITVTFDYWAYSNKVSTNNAPISYANVPYRVAFGTQLNPVNASVALVNSFEAANTRIVDSKAHYDIVGGVGVTGVSYEKGYMNRYKSAEFGIGPFKLKTITRRDGQLVTTYSDYPLRIGVHSIEETSSFSDTTTTDEYSAINFGTVGAAVLGTISTTTHIERKGFSKTNQTSRKEAKYVFDCDPEYSLAVVYDYYNTKYFDDITSQGGRLSIVNAAGYETVGEQNYSDEVLDNIIQNIDEQDWNYGTSTYAQVLSTDYYSLYGFTDGRIYSLPESVLNMALVSGGWWMGDAGGQSPAGFTSKVLIKPSEDEEQNTINQTRANSIQSYFDTNFAGKDLRFLGLSMFQQTFEVN